MCVAGLTRTLRIERLGCVPYGPMLQLQQKRHREVATGCADDTLFLLEHDSVITIGRNGCDEHILVSDEVLTARGIDVVRVPRGGDVTFHGPGQLVAYPIVQLQKPERDVQRFVAHLEEIMICTVGDFGIQAKRLTGLRGIWVEGSKIGAVGVRISKWTTLHGLALNVSTALQDFGMIVPCGLHDHGVTSMEKILHRSITMVEVENRLAHHTASVLGRTTAECPAYTTEVHR